MLRLSRVSVRACMIDAALCLPSGGLMLLLHSAGFLVWVRVCNT